MSYSLDKIPNKAYEIPEPPPYAVWVQETTWDYSHGREGIGNEGQVRHLPTLAKAKRRVSSYATYGGRSKFACDWTIYLWNKETNEYDVLYDGKTGEAKELNPLFKLKLKKGEKPEPRPGLEDEIAEALASIAEAVK